MSTDEQISLLERYVLATDKEAFFDTLVENSDTYVKMRLLDSVNRHGLDVPADVAPDLKKLLDKRENRRSLVAFRCRLLELEKSAGRGNAAELDGLLRKFNDDYLNCCFEQYGRPPNVRESQSAAAAASHGDAAKTHLALEEWDLDARIKAFADRSTPWNDVQQFTERALPQLDLGAMMDKDADCLRHVLSHLDTYAHVPAETLAKVLARYHKARRQDDDTFSFPNDWLGKMTLEQLDALRGSVSAVLKDSAFVSEWFRKTFHKDLGGVARARPYATPQEHREVLMKMHAWAKKLPSTPSNESLAAQILREVLQLDLDTNSIREDAFIEYMKRPLDGQPGLFAPTIKPVGFVDDWESVHNFQRWHWNPERDLVFKYLCRLLKTATSTAAYEPYLDREYLRRTYYRAKLLSGQSVPGVTDIFSESELTSLKEEKRLRFAPWCKRQFQTGESIDVTLEVKNVESVTVNTYVIDTDSYYRRSQVPIDERIDLTGVLPTKTTEHTFSEAPIVEHALELKNLIEPKRGVYVVEFVGGGLCSRAMIRVGALTLVSRPLSKGVLFTVVDENHALCHADSTSIILDNKELKPEEKLGFGVLIPYSTAPVHGTAVVRHEGYAELQLITVPAESVAFTFSLVLNEESMVNGGTVQLLLLPTLTVCGQPVSLVTLKKVAAEVVAVDDKGVSSSQRFEDLQVRTGKGLALNYMMTPKTVHVSVRLTAKLYSAAQTKTIDLESSQTIGINRFQHQQVLSDLHVSRDGEEYKVHLVGKDGEPYGGQKLTVHVRPRYCGRERDVELHTDKDGVAHLGAVARCATAVHLHMVDVPGGERADSQEYALFSDNAADALPAYLDAVEGEDITLPAVPSATGRTGAQYSLVEVCDYGADSVVTSHAAKLQCTNGVLVIKGLTKGVYKLAYLDHCRCVQIRVLEGKRWACSPTEYVEQSRSIEKLGNQAQCLACSPIEVRNGAVEFHVSSANLAAVEVHALAYCFAPRTMPTLLKELRDLHRDVSSCSYPITTGECSYLSERRLADEVLYVMNRKRRRDGVLGNTLEKPPGLLKRHFVRETTQDDEKLHEGSDFNAQLNMAACCDRACDDAVDGDFRQLYATPGVYERAGPNGRCLLAEAPIGPMGDYTVNVMNGFLATNGWTQFCIAPDATTGKVSFTVPANQGFSTLVVVVCDANRNIVKSVPVPQSARKLQPRALFTSRQANKVYVHERVAHQLRAGGACEITDGASYYLIDDVAAAMKVLKLIRDDTKWSEWEFLARWAALTPEERLKKYDELMCHEFNVFAYFKDQEFFNVVVKPHIQSKSTKQLIDHLLLGNSADTKKWCTLEKLSTLSAIEKAMLVHFLHGAEPELCAAVVRDLQASASAVRDDQKEFERRFDSVLAGQLIAVPQPTAAPPPPSAMHAVGGFAANAARPYMMMMKSMGAPMAEQSAPRSTLMDSPEDMEEAMMDEDTVAVERYRELDSTKEYIEKQFHESSTAPRTQYYKFWADAAAHFASGDASAPLLTKNFIYATTSVSESLLAMSLLGVPVKAAEHESRTVNGTLRLTAGSTCMAFTKVIEEKGDVKMDIDILVSQRFFDPMDRYSVADDGTKTLKAVKEFLVGRLYMSRVAVTNSTESQHEVSVVTEVPQGSVPVVALDFTTTTVMRLEPLATQVIEFYFYFPHDGDFTYFPATVNKAGCLVATAAGTGKVKAVRQRTIVEMNTLADVLNQGNCDDILAFMAKVNLRNREVFQFDAIYWLLRDASFYKGVLALLRRSAIFEPTVWSFSILHSDHSTFFEYMRWRLESLVASLDNVLYVATENLEASCFEYKEYSPLVLARTHDVGEFKHNIRNNDFRKTYLQFLTYLTQKHPRLDSKDYLFLATYLFLQERVDDVASIYRLIKPADMDGEMKIQYDYLTAYLDIYQGYPAFEQARKVSMQYVNYPVFAWRNRFIDVLNLLAEFDGDAALQPKTQETDADKNSRLAKSEPYLSCEMQGKEVCVTVRNIAAITVNLHAIDMELLFSTNPFMDADSVDCSYVMPTATVQRTVDEEVGDNVLSTVKVAVPQSLAQSNLIVHVVAGSLMESVTYMPSSMNVQVNKNFGLVKVLAEDTRKPLPKLYVKAFARFDDGDVKFFKDGYTDLRGSFEYAAVNGNASLDKIAEFSLLVCGGAHGAVIRRAPPPSKVATVNVTARALMSTQMQIAQSNMAQTAGNQYYF